MKLDRERVRCWCRLRLKADQDLRFETLRVCRSRLQLVEDATCGKILGYSKLGGGVRDRWKLPKEVIDSDVLSSG